MQEIKLEIIQNLKELKSLSNDLCTKLEDEGITITNLNKEQLFRYNIRNIIKAMEELIRNEPSEKPTMRLKKEIPDTYFNIKKLLTTKAGQNNSNELQKIQEITAFIEKNFEKL